MYYLWDIPNQNYHESLHERQTKKEKNECDRYF